MMVPLLDEDYANTNDKEEKICLICMDPARNLIEEVNIIKNPSKRTLSYNTTQQPECPHLTSVKFTQTDITEGRPEHCHTCSMGVYVQQVESDEYRCSYCNSLK